MAGRPCGACRTPTLTVYIFTGPGAVPLAQPLDERLLIKRLTGANELILPPELRDNTGVRNREIERLQDEMLGDKTDLEASLPEPLRRRFVALRQTLGAPPSRYGALPPGLAGMALAGDVTTKIRTSIPSEPMDAKMAAVAKRLKVRTRSAGAARHRTEDYFADLRRPGLACLEAMLDMAEEPPPPAGVSPALKAWADGDIRPVVEIIEKGAFGSSLNWTNRKGEIHVVSNRRACVADMPETTRVVHEIADLQYAAVVDALKKPGHAVAYMQPNSLLIKNGVLDQARKAGLTVTLPDAPE